MLVVNRLETDVNQLIFNIINYNLYNYEQVELETLGEQLDDTLHVITVRSFPGLTEASDYSGKIIVHESVLNELKQSDYYSYIISEENYATLLNDKSVTKYDKFFKIEYLR